MYSKFGKKVSRSFFRKVIDIMNNWGKLWVQSSVLIINIKVMKSGNLLIFFDIELDGCIVWYLLYFDCMLFNLTLNKSQNLANASMWEWISVLPRSLSHYQQQSNGFTTAIKWWSFSLIYEKQCVLVRN